MDFFEHQDAARKGSRRLVWLFALAVTVITLGVAMLAGAGVLLIGAQEHGAFTAQAWHALPVWQTAGLAAAITLGMIACGSLYKTAQLSGGGAAVARSLQAQPIAPDTTDPYARRLLNVVEEMALAAGCPVPAVYLMENEGAINAFAAGWSRDDAVIGVTRGAMERLTRDELQGVVAHEFSHILHGDMRLNLRMTGLVFGILGLSVLGTLLMRMVAQGATHGRYHGRYHRRDRSSNDGGAMAVIAGVFIGGTLLYIVGSLGVFFARLIQAAVSRQREFLADASAVQYTRNPEGIGHALMKIGGLAHGSRLGTAQASAFQHLFFGQATGGGHRLSAGLATHPPLGDRIARLLPAWDGRWEDPSKAHAHPERDAPRAARGPGAHPAVSGLAGVQRGRPADTPASDEPRTATDNQMPAALAFIGDPGAAHLERARALIAGLPPQLTQAARTRAGAQAVVFALLSDHRHPEVAALQQAHLDQHVDTGVAQLSAHLGPVAATLDPAARLPLLDLTLPALKTMSPHDRRGFEAHIDAVIAADQQLGLFEWALRQVLWRHLIGPAAARVRRTGRLKHHRAELAVLLSVLSRVDGLGTASGPAFAAGARVVGGLDHEPTVSHSVGAARLTDAVDRLGTLTPADTRQVIHACAAAVASDGLVSVREFALLRAVAETLDVPMPPLLPGQRLG